MKKTVLLAGLMALVVIGIFVTKSYFHPRSAVPKEVVSNSVGTKPTAPVATIQSTQAAQPVATNQPAATGALSREMDLKVNPYAAALREPGKSKRAWDANFLSHYQNAASGDPIGFELTEGRMASGVIRITQFKEGELTYMSGELSKPEAGKFFFLKPPEGGKAGKAVGVVEFPASQLAYRIEPTGPNGEPELWQRRLDEVLCVEMPSVKAAAVNTNAAMVDTNQMEAPPLRPDSQSAYIPSYNTNQNGVPIISLQSNPGSKAVLLLDFFGGSTPSWGGVNYVAPAGVNNQTIRDLWKRVAEDFMAFNINVTTDMKVFQAAPNGSRQRCCFTDTPVTAAGVAYIGSWNWGGEVQCWSVYTRDKNGAEVGAHEPGHTLGLGHQTQEIPNNGTTTHVEYYAGQGSGATGWAPIMGVGYYQPVATWSKGEFQYASKVQDEMNVIVTGNSNVAYRTDDTGDKLATSRYLEIYPDSTVFAEGVIERRADTDAFQFTTTGGQVSLFASPVGDWADLALMATLADASDTIIASNNPQSVISASIVTNLPAGTYTFRVTGAGRNNPLTDGFSDYASVGYYSISGSIVGARQPSRFEVMEHSPNGTAVGTILASDTNSTLAYSILRGNIYGTFAVDNNGAVTVANNAYLDYATLSTNTQLSVQYEIFVNITNVSNPALTELNRRVVISVLNETANNPIPFTGFNASVIVPYNATPSVPKATGFDVPNSFCFYQAGLNGNPQVGGTGGTQGLPQSGSFISQYDNTVFRFGPYGGQNALMMGTGRANYGTLTLTTPKAYNSIAILAASANGGGLGSVVVNFTDGTRSQVFNLNAQDWFGVTDNVALQGFGRLRLGQSTLSTENTGYSNPNFYQTTINLAALGLNQTVASLTFTNAPVGGSQSCGIFAVSGTVMPPALKITTQPQSQTNSIPTQPATFTAAAMGARPLGWQWYYSASGAAGTYSQLAGQTNGSLVLSAELTAANVGSYFAVVTNNSGSLTSSVATLTLFRAPVITKQPSPTNLTLFTGQTNVLSVQANAASPLTYYWKKDGNVFASGSSSSYVLGNLQITNTGNYSIVLSNAYGMATSSIVSLTVVTTPSLIYAGGVVSDKPIGFWRLNESSGNIAHDYISGKDGFYTNVVLNQTGCSAVDLDKAAGFGPSINSYVGGIPVDFGTNGNRDFTVEAWVKGNAQTTDAGIISRGTGGGGEQFNLDTGAGNHAFRFFIRDSFGTAHGANGTIAPNGAWHHVVGVVDKANLLVVLYVDGVSNASATIDVANGILNSTNPMTIGSRQSGTGAFNNQFVGTIDEVAVYNYALTSAQIKTHYNSQASLLGIISQPASQSVFIQESAQFTVVASGTPPFSYQWQAGNNGIYSKLTESTRYVGTTNATLTVNGVLSNFPTNFIVVVTNSYGIITSAPAVMTILTRSTIVLTNNDANSPFVSSFDTKGNWKDDFAPNWGGYYVVSNSFVMHTPKSSANVTFGGYSLTIAGGGALECGASTDGVVFTYGTNATTGLTLNNGRLQTVDDGRNYTVAGFVTLGSGSGSIDPYNGTVNITAPIGGSGILKVIAASTALTNGVVTLSASNNYTGGTIINAADTLRLSGPATLGSVYGALQILNSAGKGYGALDLNGTSQGVSTLSGTGGNIFNSASGTTSTLTVGNANGGGSFSGNLSDGAGTLALAKTGLGTVTLSGTNMYTGPTWINGGTLALSGAGAIQNSSSIIASNAVLDVTGLNGSFSSANSIVLKNGILNLGSVRAACGSLILSNSTLLVWTVDGSVPDVVTGALDGSGGGNYINVQALPGVSDYLTQWPVIKYASAAGIFAANNTLINLSAILPASDNITGYLTNNAANSSIDLVLINALAAPVTLTNSWDGVNLNLSWPAGLQLLQATNITGPWTTNTEASSPLQVLPAGGQMFYRLQR